MAVLAPVLKQRFFDDNGDPLVGGKLYAYVAGTTTLQDTYVDQTGSSTNANPIILDANGEADVWISDAGYKFALYDSADVLQWTVDNVYSSAFAANTSADLIDNLSIACSVATNQLTISLKDAAGNNPSIASSVKVGFRSSTLISGVITKLVVSAPLSTLVSAGSTLGHQSAVSCPIYVGLMNVSGAMELCYSKAPFDEKALISTTAEGGAGAADSGSTIYSTVARTNVAVRMVGKLLSTQTTAGTWAAVPTNTIVGNSGKILSMPPSPNWGAGSTNSSPRYNQYPKSGVNDYEFGYGSFGEVQSYTTTATIDIYTGYALCSGGTFTVTLPTAVNNYGKMIAIKKTDLASVGVITVEGNASETVEDLAFFVLRGQNESITLVSDGSNWKMLSHKGGNVSTMLTASSATKTPAATGQYQQLSSNSVTLSANTTYILSASAGFSDSGGAAIYTYMGVGIYGANGADSSSTPTLLSSTANLSVNSVNAADGGLSSVLSSNSGSYVSSVYNTGNIVVTTGNANVTVYVVTNCAMTTAANSRVNAYINAIPLFSPYT